jgi:hypothetical protein
MLSLNVIFLISYIQHQKEGCAYQELFDSLSTDVLQYLPHNVASAVHKFIQNQTAFVNIFHQQRASTLNVVVLRPYRCVLSQVTCF